MTVHVSPAIVTRIREIAEGDLLVSFFTPEKGFVKGVAKGARRSRKRFANCLDVLSLASMEYEKRRRGELHHLHSCKLIHGFPGIRSNFASMALGGYMLELTEVLFPQGVADRDMFDRLRACLMALDEGVRQDRLLVYFQGAAMAIGGYEIAIQNCCVCRRRYAGRGRAVFVAESGGIACLKCRQETRMQPGLSPESVKALEVIQAGSWADAKGLSWTDSVLKELKRLLKTHVRMQIGKELRSEKYLE